jgi:hypothetical protein
MSGQRAANASRYAALADLAERMLALRGDPRPWMQGSLYIRDKQRQVIPLRLNDIQRDYHAHATARDLILKSRQVGVTTYVCAVFFTDCLLRPNTTSVIVAHDYDSAQRIFRIVQLFWERLPERERLRVGSPRFSNRREFFWPRINSQFYVGTAGSLAFGRGQTINNLHCSEFAFWPKPEESLIALAQAVPAGGRIVIESTANGRGGHFHQLWQETQQGRTQFAGHYYVWFESAEYAELVTPEEERDIRANLTPDETDLVRRYHLGMGQIKWRREKQRDLKELFRQEYPEDDVSCFLASTRACFDSDALGQAAARIAAEPAPERVAAIPALAGKVVPVAPARLLVWKRPQAGGEYVIGADVGEGLAGGDASCAVVLERRSGEQVAELHGLVPPDRFGHLLDVLGRWYGRALLAVERNNHGHSTLNTLRNACHYPRLYFHVRYDARAGMQPMLGWPTDQATKPILVDDLVGAITEGSVIIHSGELVDECMSFVVKDSGAQEAQEGAHDDRVMALGIAWQVRKRAVARGTTQRPEGM